MHKSSAYNDSFVLPVFEYSCPALENNFDTFYLSISTLLYSMYLVLQIEK